jgi:hypothetical protein
LGTRSEDCGDNGGRRGAARAAAVAARKTLPSDGHIRAHAQELITFSPRQKTDWGKKRTFFEDLFWPRIKTRLTDMRKREHVDGKPVIDKINKMNMISLTISL